LTCAGVTGGLVCGIAGVVGSTEENIIKDMTAALYHRGPDSSGFFSDRDIHLGMRRLSIIDLVSGDQPIFNSDRSKSIIFNGEIYNYKLLRNELISKGDGFATSSDTEVILKLYERYGTECLNKLRGMFAFAIWDADSLVIARDRLGIKPLYYYLTEDRKKFAFASEIKALLRCEFISAAIDEQALIDRMVMGYIIGDGTYFKGIRCLMPGHYLKVSRRAEEIELEQKAYYELEVEADEGMSFEQAKARLGEMIGDSVCSHLVADVEVGLTLSGGVDSSILALVMKQFYPSTIHTFSIGDNGKTSDIEQARVMADYIGSDHSENVLEFDDYLSQIPRYVWAEEQPPTLFGLPSFCLFSIVSRKLKVCLNGEGADELFGGYSTYLDRTKTIASARAGLSKVRELGLAPRNEVTEVVDYVTSAPSYEEYLKRFFLIGLKDQLVRHHLDLVDKYAMASGLEVRVPFLDNEFVDFVTKIPVSYRVNRDLGVGKYILKRAGLDMFGEVMIDVILRRKYGFPSAGYYYLSKLDRICEESLSDDYVSSHELGRCFTSKRELLLFDLFRLLFVEHRAAVPDGFDLLDFLRQKAKSRSVTFAT
jgi:asparagine synthase (glutamine-hydrolysing)